MQLTTRPSSFAERSRQARRKVALRAWTMAHDVPREAGAIVKSEAFSFPYDPSQRCFHHDRLHFPPSTVARSLRKGSEPIPILPLPHQWIKPTLHRPLHPTRHSQLQDRPTTAQRKSVVRQLATITPKSNVSNAKGSGLSPRNGALRVPSAAEVMVRRLPFIQALQRPAMLIRCSSNRF